MAFGYYMNMEKLTLDIIEENIFKMKSNNYINEEIDEEKFINNLKYGYICIIMLENYIESSINTFLSYKFEYTDDNNITTILEYTKDKLLKSNFNEKLNILYLNKNLTLKELKDKYYYKEYINMKKIRNQLIHYKDSYLGHCGSSIPVLGNEKNPIIRYKLSDYFVKSKIIKAKECSIKLIEHIAKDMDVKINKDCDVIGCDGVNPEYAYITKY